MKLRSQDNLSARALEFIILTAARTGEVIEATWAEVNLADQSLDRSGRSDEVRA